MSGPYGRMRRDLFGESLHILGRLVLDPDANLYVANATMDNAIVRGNIYTKDLTELVNGQGITVNGNVYITPPHILTVDTLIANNIVGNITITSYNFNHVRANVVTANAFIGNLFGDVVGTVFGDVYGNLDGNIVCETITTPKPNAISVVILANVIIDDPGTSLVCPNIFCENLIEDITNQGITIFGDIKLPDHYIIYTSNIREPVSGEGITVQGNVDIVDGTLHISGSQVVGPRLQNIPYNNGTLGNISTTVNNIITVLREHGLIG